MISSLADAVLSVVSTNTRERLLANVLRFIQEVLNEKAAAVSGIVKENGCNGRVPLLTEIQLARIDAFANKTGQVCRRGCIATWVVTQVEDQFVDALCFKVVENSVDLVIICMVIRAGWTRNETGYRQNTQPFCYQLYKQNP